VKPRYSKNNTSLAKKVFIESLGCSKNLVKSEAIASLLRANGYAFCASFENSTDAEIIIINTCGFIKSARQEAESVINKFKASWIAGKKVVVVGCYASRFSKILKKKFPLCTIIENMDPVIGIQQALELENSSPRNRIVSTNAYAYLEIATGCSKSCSYCLIPSIQGSFTSKSKKIILTEIQNLCEQNNLKEIVLIAQDTASYGLDLHPRDSLLSLVTSLSTIKSIDWIRIMYLYPILSVDTLQKILSTEKVIPYLDMPLQHFSPKILHLMNRPENIELYMDKLFQLKSEHPVLTLRSTFMVGFPGEKEEDFEILKRGLLKYPFDRAGFFSYSREKETTADSLPEQVHSSTKKKRLQEAYSIQETISREQNQKYIGKTLPVLLESFEPTKQIALGRTYREAPEVDPVVTITGNPFRLKRKIGSIQTMKITQATAYEIQGSLQE
jgi:ribosomal protein S12 methylthiotransferase